MNLVVVAYFLIRKEVVGEGYATYGKEGLAWSYGVDLVRTTKLKYLIGSRDGPRR
jgi:hypothetical protein